MAKPIDEAVEHCHHFVDEMAAIEHAFGPNAVTIRSNEARYVYPHLVSVLLELERLQTVERDYMNLLHLEHGERIDD